MVSRLLAECSFTCRGPASNAVRLHVFLRGFVYRRRFFGSNFLDGNRAITSFY